MPQAWTVGTVLEEKYRLESFLGQGGMCSVFRAEHLQLHRAVAVKVLRPALLVDPDAVRRFQREAQAVAVLSHPNIVEAYEFGLYDAQPYLVIEYLEGRDLAQILQEDGPLSGERFLRIATQICDALAQAHSRGVIHRDLKPSNIMVLRDDVVKVVDFGIARVLPESGKELQRLTQTGEVLGTVSYMAPERFNADVKQWDHDPRIDIYSLGCLLYEMLTGKSAFGNASPFEVIAMHFDADPQEDVKLGTYQATVMKCLAKAPDERPHSADSVKKMLLNPTSSHLKAKSKKQLAVSTGVSLTLLAVALGVIVAIWLVSQLVPATDSSIELDPSYVKELALSADKEWDKHNGEGQLAARQDVQKAYMLAQKLHMDESRLQPLRMRLVRTYIHGMKPDPKSNELKKLLATIKTKRDYPQSVDNFSEYNQTLRGLGDSGVLAGDYAEAEYWFKREVAYDEAYNSNQTRYPYLKLMHCFWTSHQWRDSLEYAKLTEKSVPSPLEREHQEAQIGEAEAHYAMGDMKRALLVLDDIMKNGMPSREREAQIKRLREHILNEKHPMSKEDYDWFEAFNRPPF